MKNNNNNNNEYSYDKLVLNTDILTEDDPIKLLHLFSDGYISRTDAWRLMQLIHQGEYDCGLPQYGLLTVFSLAKDYKQFTELYEQGCDMLRDNKILTDEIEKGEKIRITKILLQNGIDINEQPVKVTKSAKKPNKNNKNNKNKKIK